MKKILIARDLHVLLEQNKTFLNRTDVKAFVADTSDDALRMHRTERADLIITRIDLPGMSCEQFCSQIRADETLRTVSIILVSPNTSAALGRCAECRANAVLLQPVHPLVLMVKAQQLLDIAARETLRVLLRADVDTRSGDESFICRSRNISATGMLIESDKRLAEGSRMSCIFYLPNARKVQVTGKVVRIHEQAPGDEEFQYGLMFMDVTPETRQLLIDFVGSTLNRQAVLS